MGSLPPSWRNQPSFDDEDENYPPTQGGTYPPAQNYPPTGQAGANYPPQQAGGYPPQGNYPPQQPPQGATYPPQGNYPPAGASYPPQGTGGYPPPQTGNINLDAPQYGGQPAGYPPQGTGGYPPPQTGNISLDAPQYSGQPASYPPQGTGSYPPQGTGGYPPAQPQPNYAQQTGPIDLGDPLQGTSRRGSASRQEFAGDAPVSLDDPRIENRSSRRQKPSRSDDSPQLSDRQQRTGFGLTERQVEYLAWGSTIILLGVSLMMSVAGSARYLTLIFPLVAGGILMSSAIYQRVVRGWHVGPLTWLTAILLVSYTITLQLSGDGTNIFKWIAYFLGTLTIMTGLTLFLQVFRKH